MYSHLSSVSPSLQLIRSVQNVGVHAVGFSTRLQPSQLYGYVLQQIMPDVSEVLLRFMDTVHATFEHTLPHNCPDPRSYSRRCSGLGVGRLLTFWHCIALESRQSEAMAKFTIFRFQTFPKIRQLHCHAPDCQEVT